MQLENRGDGAHDTAQRRHDQFGGEPEADEQRLCPEMLTHPYARHALNEAIVLYRGTYCLPPSDPDDQDYHGTIVLTWLPEPEIEARGKPTVTLPERLAHLGEHGAWTTIPIVRLPASTVLPPSPAAYAGDGDAAAQRPGVGEELTTMIRPPEFGDGDKLTRVAGVVVNGFEVWDGGLVMDPAGWRFPISARTVAYGSEWVVTMDAVAQSGAGWKAVKSSRGYQVTQVLELTRADSAEFSAQQAKLALEAIGYALTIALGRHVSVSLPIGFNAQEPRLAS